MKKIKFLENKKIVALLAGAFMALAFAPLHFFIAAMISLPVFYLLLEKTEGKKPIFWLGFCFGFGHFLAGIYWIAISLLTDVAQFGWLIPFALSIIPSILALYIGLFALSYKFLISKFNLTQNYQKIPLFAICWIVFEVLRANLLSGFPWNLLGYIWMFDLHFAQFASVFGIYGLSFFAVLIGLFPILFLSKKIILGDKILAAMLTVFIFANLLFGFLHIDEKKLIHDEKTVLRLVQANIKQEIKWEDDQKYKNFRKMIDLTNSKSLYGVKAVIWPETAIPYIVDNNPELLRNLSEAVPQNGLLISGGLRLQRDEIEENKILNIWNSVFVISKNSITQHYDKHHLVPFGEYVPLHRFLAFLFIDKVVDKITGGGVGFSEGEGAQTLATENFSFSPLICYEVIFSNQVVNKIHRPDLFINVTNDAWFGNSSGPYQHFDMAKMRAIEYGISLVRVAGTGISALVDPYGRVVSKIDLNEEGIIDVELVKNNSPTIYATYGNLPLIFLILLILFILTVSPRKNHDTRQNHTN